MMQVGKRFCHGCPRNGYRFIVTTPYIFYFTRYPLIDPNIFPLVHPPAGISFPCSPSPLPASNPDVSNEPQPALIKVLTCFGLRQSPMTIRRGWYHRKQIHKNPLLVRTPVPWMMGPSATTFPFPFTPSSSCPVFPKAVPFGNHGPWEVTKRFCSRESSKAV